MFADGISCVNVHVDRNLMMSISHANLVFETKLVLEESSAVKVLGSSGWPQGSESGSRRSRGHSAAFYLPKKGTLEGTLSHLFIHCVLSTIKESSRSTAAAEGGACLR